MTVATALHDLRRLEQLYRQGFQDPFLDNALHKIIAHQIARDEADLQRINAALATFESTYGLTSDDFFRQFQAGQMADSADFMEWNVFCKMRQRILARLKLLRGDDGHE